MVRSGREPSIRSKASSTLMHAIVYRAAAYIRLLLLGWPRAQDISETLRRNEWCGLLASRHTLEVCSVEDHGRAIADQCKSRPKYWEGLVPEFSKKVKLRLAQGRSVIRAINQVLVKAFH